MNPRVTIVVPTFNEEILIPRFERQLASLEGKFNVIFTDGFSKDQTFNLITYPKIQEARGRGAQLNAGAKYANTEYIWFLHIDTKIHPESIRAIEDSGAEVGCFTIRFDSKGPVMKVEEWCSIARVTIRNVAFGDQGIFIKKDLFDQIGGYKEIPIMEDYQLSLDIKEMGLKFKQLKLPIGVSARKFRKEGPINTIIRMQYLQHLYRQGEDIEKIKKLYYGD